MTYRYITATVEQLAAVTDLMMATGAQEAVVLDLGVGRVRARCYSSDDSLMFSVLVDDTGTVHDLHAEGAEP